MEAGTCPNHRWKPPGRVPRPAAPASSSPEQSEPDLWSSPHSGPASSSPEQSEAGLKSPVQSEPESPVAPFGSCLRTASAVCQPDSASPDSTQPFDDSPEWVQTGYESEFQDAQPLEEYEELESPRYNPSGSPTF